MPAGFPHIQGPHLSPSSLDSVAQFPSIYLQTQGPNPQLSSFRSKIPGPKLLSSNPGIQLSSLQSLLSLTRPEAQPSSFRCRDADPNRLPQRSHIDPVWSASQLLPLVPC